MYNDDNAYPCEFHLLATHSTMPKKKNKKARTIKIKQSNIEVFPTIGTPPEFGNGGTDPKVNIGI